MIRKHFHLPKEQIDYISDAALNTDVSMSEILRRIIQKHILEAAPKTSSSSSQVKGGTHGR